MRIQVVGGIAARRGALADGSAWAWLSAVAVGMRAYWLQRRTRSGALDRQPTITSASSAERRPDETSAAPGLAAFDRFYTRHEQPLYGYLRRMLPSHEIAVEVAQETFFRAWRHFDALSAYERPEAWLYRVATNLAISHLRRRRPQSFSSLLTRAHVDDADELVGADLIAAPLDMEGQTVERDMIERALRALPERQRAALLLTAVQGLATDEIAAALDVTPDNARKILSRARERFRSLYDEAQRPTT